MRRGQIGRHLSKGQRTVNLPEVVQGFDDCEIVSIHASGDHSAALSGWFRIVTIGMMSQFFLDLLSYK